MHAVAIDAITTDPAFARWLDLAEQRPRGEALGRSLEDWRRITRRELGLPESTIILGTGHQPTLWHTGILAKYLAIDALAKRRGASCVNIIVDQDVVDFATLEVPVRRDDGALAARRVEFNSGNVSKEVPVGRVAAFEPGQVVVAPLMELPALGESVARVRDALAANALKPNAALQVAGALERLMRELAGIDAMPLIPASTLMATSLARALLKAMADDPHRCAEAYNRAVASQPEARMAPLATRDDYVELPLWRLRDNGSPFPARIRAYDGDVERVLEAASSGSNVVLLPRALLMTAIVRIGVSDLFVHGRGGALYDLAMERWIRDWLGVGVSPMAVASADVRLPLMNERDLASVRGERPASGLANARHRVRRLLHDPESAAGSPASAPGAAKQSMLREIESLPRRSRERRTAFYAMHARLEEMRRQQVAAIANAEQELARKEALSRDAITAQRRDWCFALHSENTLRELRDRIEKS